MEEKEINSIAGAVSRELAKLNKETADTQDSKDNQRPDDIFKCPDCGSEVIGGIKYCAHCGCELEWEA